MDPERTSGNGSVPERERRERNFTKIRRNYTRAFPSPFLPVPFFPLAADARVCFPFPPHVAAPVVDILKAIFITPPRMRERFESESVLS